MNSLHRIGTRYSRVAIERGSAIPWPRIASCYQFGEAIGTILSAALLALHAFQWRATA
jgi:hypothetical protein